MFAGKNHRVPRLWSIMSTANKGHNKRQDSDAPAIDGEGSQTALLQVAQQETDSHISRRGGGDKSRNQCQRLPPIDAHRIGFIYLSTPTPTMMGTTIRKEKRAASSRVSPRNSPVEMVAPEREMPGAMASP